MAVDATLLIRMAADIAAPRTMHAGPIAIAIAVAVAAPLLRRALADALAGRDDVELRLAAGSIAELAAAGWNGAEVVVVDAGGDLQEDVTALSRPRVVVLADAGDERIGEWLIDGCAVLPRDASADAICAAVHAAVAGLVATSPALAADALRYERLGEVRRDAAPAPLTPREREVLARMSEGSSNREIGASLGISAHTAKFHVAQIIAKLDAQSRAHAVAKALRAGWVDV